jgi:probable HAF family extracellular repeat protein
MIKSTHHHSPPGVLLVLILWLVSVVQQLVAQVPNYTGAEIISTFTPKAINASGQMAGNISTAGGSIHAARYSGGVITDLGVLPGGDHSEATGINASGQVVGNSTTGNGLTRGFVSSGSGMTDLGTLPRGFSSHATAINDAGQITGWGDTLKPNSSFPQPDHAFLYSGGAMTDLGNISNAPDNFGNFSAGMAINSSGEVAGWSIDANFDTHAFRFSGGHMNDLGTLGGTESRATGINDSGTVVGWSNTSSDAATHAFKYAGSMTDLGTLSGNNGSSATAINNAGQIVGTSRFSGTPAFIYTDLTGMVKLDTHVSGDGWILSGASSINSAGQIIAYGANSTVFATYFLLSPPATAPAISTHPVNVTVNAGQNASFTVAATGTPVPVLQWQLSTDAGSNWSNLSNGPLYSGVGTPTLTVIAPLIGQSGYRYRARATSTAGSAFSNVAVLTVNAAPPAMVELTIVHSGANVILTWPASASGYFLQSTTDPGSPAVWSTVSPGPTIVNGQNTVTIPVSGTRKFYRLSQ